MFVRLKNMRTFASPNNHGLVVQLVRIRACHARGRGFEPRPDRFIKINIEQNLVK